MKRYLYICLIVIMAAVGASLSYAFLPWDIAYQSLPTSITFDIPEETSQISGNLQSLISQAHNIALQTKSEYTSLKSAVTSTFNKFKSNAIVPAESTPGDIKSTFCGKDIKDVDVKEISNKMQEIFIKYNSKKIEDVNRKKRLRNKFYIESIYAINYAAASLRQEVQNSIDDKLTLAKACAEGSGEVCGIPSTDEGGNNEVLFAYGQTLETFDSLVRLWESVTALKAQFKALQVMQQIPLQLEIPADDSKEDSQEDSALILPPGVLHQREEFAFAQVSYEDAPQSVSDIDMSFAIINSSSDFMQKTVDFVSPTEADNEHPLIAAESKLEALSNLSPIEDLVNAAMSAHNMLKTLQEDKETADQLTEMYKDYDKYLQRLKKSEQCSINYLRGYFADPITVWSGINLGDNVYQHDLRKGISGWAINAYEVAKAAEASTISADDVAQISLDNSELDDLSDDPDTSKAQSAAQNIDTSINTSTQEAADEENRKSSLLSWQIGAEAAKTLGNDAASWGTPKGKSMIWTDTKNFYKQYLRRKYDNIKAYLKSYTRDDVLALVMSRLNGGSEDISETKYQQELQKLRDEANNALNDAVSALSAYDEANEAKLKELEQQRASLVAEMDKVNSAITADSNEIADMRSVATDQAAQKIDETINAKVVYPAVGEELPEEPVGDKILGASGLSSAISTAAEANIDNEKISALENQISANKSLLASYQPRLEKIDNEVAQAKIDAQTRAAAIAIEKADIISAVKEDLNNTVQQKSQEYAADVRENLLAYITGDGKNLMASSPLSIVAKAERTADYVLAGLYDQVDAIVDSTYNQLVGLGDSLYNPATHPQVVAIHEQMIAKIKALTISYTVAGYIDLDNLTVYAKLLSSDTSPETEGFFVGNPAKERDLKAPYAMPNFNLPPVREVFHFDSTDFINVKPFVEGNTNRDISAEAFLSFGGDIPLIWQYMLQDHAFIESDFNLKDVLSSGCEDIAFSRGGIMPCVVKGSSIVLDVTSKGEYIKRDDLKASSLPECLLIDVKDGVLHHTFWDGPVKLVQPTAIDIAQGAVDLEASNHYCAYSELGMLLEADDYNNLRFRNRAFEAYSTLLQDNDDEEELDDEQKNKLASANQAVLSRNQIGDFLHQVEAEKLQRENLEEYQQKYDDRMNELKEALRAYGFEPTEDFDLRNDEDYKLAEQKLQEIKDENILSALSALSDIDQTDNEPVQEKVGILSRLISVLQQDKQNVLKISTMTADNNDIAGELKKAEADKAVVDKYKNSLKDETDDYNEIEDAYCANY